MSDRRNGILVVKGTREPSRSSKSTPASNGDGQVSKKRNICFAADDKIAADVCSGDEVWRIGMIFTETISLIDCRHLDSKRGDCGHVRGHLLSR